MSSDRGVFLSYPGEHFKVVCKHGAVVSQCRCPAKDKTVRVSETCPTNCLEQFTVDEETA